MHFKFTKSAALTMLAGIFTCIFFMNNSGGPASSGNRRTGASFDGGNCTSCHSGGSFSPVTTVELLSGTTPVTSYSPGSSYTVRITITGTGILTTTRYGFQIVSVQSATNTNINGWSTPLPASTHNVVSSSRNYVEHTARLTTNVISIPWTAPSTGTGSVAFYASGLICNANSGTSGDNCASTSLTVTECLPPAVTPSVTNVSCNGGSNGAVALTVSGTGTISYAWTGPSGYSAATRDISGLSAGVYTVVASNGVGCATTRTVAVTEPSAISVTPSSNAPICVGNTLLLTSSVTGGTTPYSYSWTGPAGFSSTAANPTITSVTASHAGTYTLVVTDAMGCNRTATTTVALNTSPIVSLGPDVSICSGGTVTLNAGNPGSTYMWNTTATTQMITVSTPGTYHVSVTNAGGCVGRDTIVIGSATSSTPSIAISASDDSICGGTSVTFTASTSNGGSSPAYQWKVNGTVVSAAGSTYTTSTLANNDSVTCTLVSSLPCAIPSVVNSNKITMHVSPGGAASLGITASKDSLCSGDSVLLTALPVNAGTAPIIWYIGTTPVDTALTYMAHPSAGDVVSARFTSTLPCAVPASVSTAAPIVVFPSLVPSISVLATLDTVTYLGQVVSFFTDVTFAGSSPVFQWYVNGVAIAGANSPTYSRNIYYNDTVWCTLVSSMPCANPKKDTSNKVTIWKGSLGVNNITTLAGITIVPNPASEYISLNVSGAQLGASMQISIYDMVGRQVLATSIEKATAANKIQLPLHLQSGRYWVRILNAEGSSTLPLVIEK